ncbi:unnamed protein product [Ceutorhynchus assimilis]|uniref:Uncharacterized protein n=1 Tax=Ceutorhynchus assimilis TaxID=467358 RepID=A0A9N9MJT4_9CUCU|nr:unnamed protein product [Ceutorhynchus assimilis]
MDKKITCVFISCLALAQAGLILVPSAKFLEGPSTRTKVIGPDGSIIDAYAPGGKILLEDNQAGPLLQAAPVVLAQPAIAVAEPHYFGLQQQELAIAEPPKPVATNAVLEDNVNIEASKISRVSEDGQKVLLHPGTPERVETRESVPVTEETSETVTATELPETTYETESSSPDLSGEYIPDKFEHLFDDGSYRPEHY